MIIPLYILRFICQFLCFCSYLTFSINQFLSGSCFLRGVYYTCVKFHSSGFQQQTQSICVPGSAIDLVTRFTYGHYFTV